MIDHDPGGKIKILLEENIISSAIFSDCQKYRFELHRRWDNESDKSIMFLMMNPSVATEFIDDPTVKKCRKYATTWGYNHLIVTNVMAYRATNPKELLQVYDPVGKDNLKHIKILLEEYKPFLICAWGRIPTKLFYAEEDVMRVIKDHSPHVLKLNKDGKPWHPLYLPNNTLPEPWNF